MKVLSSQWPAYRGHWYGHSGRCCLQVGITAVIHIQEANFDCYRTVYSYISSLNTKQNLLPCKLAEL